MSCPTNQPFCLHHCVPQQHSVSASQAPQNKLFKTIISQRQTFCLCHCVSQQHSASVVSVSLCVTTAPCICCVCVTSTLHLLCLSLHVTTALCICCVCVTVCHYSTPHLLCLCHCVSQQHSASEPQVPHNKLLKTIISQRMFTILQQTFPASYLAQLG